MSGYSVWRHAVLMGMLAAAARSDWPSGMWQSMVSTGSPALAHHDMAYDGGHGKLVLVGTDAMAWPRTNWPVYHGDSNLTWSAGGELPSGAGHDPEVAYDTSRGVTVVYTGTNVVWEYDGASWSRIVAATMPVQCYDGAMLEYDSARQEIVLVGCDQYPATNAASETWSWNGTDWTQACDTAHSPTGAAGGAMAFDAERGKLVLVTMTDMETWTFNGTNWAQQFPSSSPTPGVWVFHMAYEPNQKKVILYGGEGGSFPSAYYPSNTWAWDGTDWHQLDTVDNPGGNIDFAFDFFPPQNGLIMHGGWCDPDWVPRTNVWRLSLSSAAVTHYVVPSNSGALSPYTNWATAATNIQAAVDVASGPGDVVLVTNGSYFLAAGVVISNAITVKSVNGPAVTALNGRDAVRCVFVSHLGAVVDGFSLTNGHAGEGAGARIEAGLLTNCFAVANWASSNAGGVYCGPQGRVQNCLVKGNGAANLGGGVVCGGGTVCNSRVEDNWAMYGGGLACTQTGLLRNSEFVGNRASYGGGGVCILSNSQAVVENCTIAGNYSEEGYGGLQCMSTGSVFVNSIIYGNLAKFSSNLTAGGQSFLYCCSAPADPGEGNLTNNPVFLSLDMLDCRLATNSPCINTGTNLPWMTNAVDVRNGARILGGRTDIGANEAGPFGCAFSADRRGGVVSVPVWFLSRVTGTNVANPYYRWDYDNNGTPDASGYGLESVTNPYAVVGGYSVAVLVSNSLGETVRCVRSNLVAALSANVLYVSTNGSGYFPYLAWTSASRSIRAAVDAAPDGALIRITNGVYAMAREAEIARTGTVKSVNGPTNVIVVGTGHDRCFALRTPAAIVDGLTITNGIAADGGGIHMTRGGLVTNCVVVGNMARTNGGGVFISLGGQVKNSTVRGNTAGFLGGGLFCATDGSILDCAVRDNATARDGGGLNLNFGGLARNCVFSNNQANIGGGVFCFAAGLVTNCFLVGNLAQGWGGGFASYAGAVLAASTALNNRCDRYGGGAAIWGMTGFADRVLFVGNSASNAGGGLYLEDGIVLNSTFSNNWSADGGGIYIMAGSTSANCRLVGNWASHDGGGFNGNSSTNEARRWFVSGYTVISNTAGSGGGGGFCYSGEVRACTFLANTSGWGGGVYAWSAPIFDSAFSNNLAANGGGVYLLAGSTCANCRLVGNRASQDGGGVHCNTLTNDGRRCAISGCVAVSNYAERGGGAYCWSGDVRACTFLANTSYWGGGAFVSAGVIADSAFSNNAANDGGGMYMNAGSTAVNCRLIYNRATHDGGGMNINTVTNDPRVSQAFNCTAMSNRAVGAGGGAFVYRCGVQGGYFAGNTSSWGGGVYAWTASIRDGSISNNQADSFGGGLYARSSSTISNCQVRGNLAWNAVGGGAYCESSSIFGCSFQLNMAPVGGGAAGYGDYLIESNVFVRNQAHIGGGLFLNAANPSVGTARCCYAGGNAVDNSGGGIYVMTGTVENCVVVTNIGPWGGGVYLNNNSRMQSCTLVGNLASSNGGGVFCLANGSVWNSIIYSNLAARGDNIYTDASFYVFNNSCTWPLPPGTGNITNNPRLASWSGDCRLSSNSPCIDAASTSEFPRSDFVFVPRPLDGNSDGTNRADMGACEFVHPLADSDGDWLRDTNELALGTSPLNADCDGDRMTDGAEALAGTLPLDAASFLGLTQIVRQAGATGVVVRWMSVDGKRYTVSRSTNLLAGFDYDVRTNILGVAPANTETDTTAVGTGPWTYRIELE